jgi:hypothetical protein
MVGAWLNTRCARHSKNTETMIDTKKFDAEVLPFPFKLFFLLPFEPINCLSS